jgi:hypothetical protein
MHLSDAEIANLDNAVARKKHILRLEVAMQNTLRVDVLQSRHLPQTCKSEGPTVNKKARGEPFAGIAQAQTFPRAGHLWCRPKRKHHLMRGYDNN